MTALTPERIAELRALLAKATPAPWEGRDGGGHNRPSIVGADCVQVAGWEGRIGGISNASYSEEVCEFHAQMDLPAPSATRALIVALRNDAPALLDLAEIGLGRTCYDASAERAAKWKACAEELADELRDTHRGPTLWHATEQGRGAGCTRCAALARFDALAREDSGA